MMLVLGKKAQEGTLKTREDQGTDRKGEVMGNRGRVKCVEIRHFSLTLVLIGVSCALLWGPSQSFVY